MKRKTVENLTRDEKSFLLYIEACAVDNSGMIDQRQMNDEDRAIMKRWVDEGFVTTGRVASEYIQILKKSEWVHLSLRAFKLAHLLRLDRAKRKWNSRSWITTGEKKEIVFQYKAEND